MGLEERGDGGGWVGGGRGVGVGETLINKENAPRPPPSMKLIASASARDEPINGPGGNN